MDARKTVAVELKAIESKFKGRVRVKWPGSFSMCVGSSGVR